MYLLNFSASHILFQLRKDKAYLSDRISWMQKNCIWKQMSRTLTDWFIRFIFSLKTLSFFIAQKIFCFTKKYAKYAI